MRQERHTSVSRALGAYTRCAATQE